MKSIVLSLIKKELTGPNKASRNIATETLDGIMSHYDKIKMNTIETNANYYDSSRDT